MRLSVICLTRVVYTEFRFIQCLVMTGFSVLIISPLPCTYMFNRYRNQLSRQTGSRNLTGPKTLPTIWYTYMMLVTKYQISAINSYLFGYDRFFCTNYIPASRRGRGVYCFTSVRLFVRPSVRPKYFSSHFSQ
jgi:hypothetical protein